MYQGGFLDGAVVSASPLSPHSKEALIQIPPGTFQCGVYMFSHAVHVWILSGHSGFFLLSKKELHWLTYFSNLSLGVTLSGFECVLSLATPGY